MAQAAQVLRTALLAIFAIGAEAEIEGDEFNDAIEVMNNFMFAQDADGVKLGYTFVDDLSDEITIPPGALMGLIANVAILSEPFYPDATISQALILAAERGLRTMEHLGVTVGNTQFPGTLPVGSGNEGDCSGFHQQHFYPNLEAQILAEISGVIGLEADTEAAS